MTLSLHYLTVEGCRDDSAKEYGKKSCRSICSKTGDEGMQQEYNLLLTFSTSIISALSAEIFSVMHGWRFASVYLINTRANFYIGL